MALVCVCILIKAFYIQQVQGKMWRSMSDSLHQKLQEIDAERGTIYSEDGQMLSTSIPQFNVFIDFGAEGLREKSGKHFRENVDSLSICLANLFKDRTAGEYKQLLKQGYKDEDRYFELRKNISFREYEQLRTFPLVRLGRNKSGFIAEDQSIRLNPYKLLAYRTIGLDRENAQKIGLEQTYDSLLKGRSGKRLVRFIAGGVSVPVDDYQIEPETGKDIVTTLDVFVQEITENALMRMMISNQAEHGCAIVMETSTGKIKAIANLGKRSDGNYSEDFNYAINPSEPGSTFKLVTMLSLLEDKKINLNSIVNLHGGTYQLAGQTVFDSEQHGRYEVTVKQAFELSSNVGMAQLAYNNYHNNPNEFINHLKVFRMDTLTGIDITGERKPVVFKPGTRGWSATTLPWMAFGYNIAVTPMQTLMLYNSIANNGKMMRPYLLNSVKDEGKILKEFNPTVVDGKICSEETLKQIKECLEGVCIEGTAKDVFKNSPYKVAGKTGTALVADEKTKYSDHVYQTSFAGYFPADNPQYTIVVVIKNRPNAALHYGATVAGPVFKEIADRLYTTYVKQTSFYASTKKIDSSSFGFTGMKSDVREIMNGLKMSYKDSTGRLDEWVNVNSQNATATLERKYMPTVNTMPQLHGMNLKDALLLCENMGLKVNVKGKGKVMEQSIMPGQGIAKGQLVQIALD